MVTESVPVEITSAGTVITEHEYKTLLGMLKSTDEQNHKVAQLLLNGCDVEKSIYWIWKLTCEGSWTITNRMVYLRTKASREFRDKCNLFVISNQDSESFAKWLLEKDWLTTEIFQYLRESIIKDLKGQCNNQFFDLYTTIKGEYAQYDPDNKHEPL